MEEALRQEQDRSRRTFLLTRTAVVFVRAGRITEANPATATLLGFRDPGQLAGVTVLDLVHPEDRQATDAWLGTLGPGDQRADALAARLIATDGRQVQVELLALGVHRHGEAVVQLLAYDLTEQKHAVETLTYQSLHDVLTGLPNRLLFIDRVRQALARMARADIHVAVFFCDLDRFQIVNDSLGHATGDEVLRLVADRLRGCLRPADTVARFGGDEFVVLCEVSPDPADAAAVARRMLATVAEPCDVGGTPLGFTASIGVVVATDRFTEPEDLIRDAAAALTQAKERGRNRFEVFDETTRARAIGRMQIESSLRRAIDERQLRVYYQPILACGSGRLVGVEALVRWQHPEHGFLLPGSFIPVAEDSGLIVSLGNWVLEEACRQAGRWEGLLPEGETLQVSVNLSAHQLHDPELVALIQRALAPPVPGSARQVFLALEVTETTLVRDNEQTVEILDRLDQLGVHIGIDDFGTGYSSLSYLKRFPVTSIKVDQSFVAGIDADPDDRAIVAAVVQLAHHLGLTVVAEGVERPSQLDILQEMGCDLVQGFLFGRPLAPDALTRLVAGAAGPVTLAPIAGTVPVASPG